MANVAAAVEGRQAGRAAMVRNVAVGLVVVLIGLSLHHRLGMGALVWSAALFSSGAFLGFLFALPRVGTEGNKDEPDRGRSIVNPSLELLSDWLTKVLVGLGLVELREAPRNLKLLSDQVAASFASAAPENGSVALALCVALPIVGLLTGYLTTRLRLQPEIVRADLEVLDRLTRKVERLSVDQRDLSIRQEVIVSEQDQSESQPSEPIDETLLRWADEYLSINLNDYRARLHGKNDLAARMAARVNVHGISRDELAAASNEGLLMALVSAVHAQPRPADVARVLNVSQKVARLHVRYRVALALRSLAERGFLSGDDRDRALRVLGSYEPDADASLQQAIKATVDVIKGAMD